jgi:queuine/archaeosine tRNA-ribosyltransferase
MYRITSTDGEARTGLLVLNNGREINTPAMLLYTRRGGSLHLTPDLLDTLRPDAQALQLNVFSL